MVRFQVYFLRLELFVVVVVVAEGDIEDNRILSSVVFVSLNLIFSLPPGKHK